MTFSTLDGLRTGRLNAALGLSSDSDDSFGSTTYRNNAIKVALAQLWPRMARLQRETLTVVDSTFDYDLTKLREVQAIEVVGVDSSDVYERIGSWRLIVDEAADPRVPRIRFDAMPLAADATLRLVGYAPYKSEFASGSTSSDIPPDCEWVVILGAQAELYRMKLNQRLNFQAHAVANRDTDTSVTEIVAAYQLVRREFNDAVDAHPRQFIAARTDRTTRRR